MDKPSIWKNSKRMAEIETLTVSVKAMKSVRKLVLISYLVIAAFILLTAGVITVTVHAITQFQDTGALYFDALMVTGLILVAVPTLASIWLLSERQWISALKLDQMIEHALEGIRPPIPREPQTTNP